MFNLSKLIYQNIILVFTAISVLKSQGSDDRDMSIYDLIHSKGVACLEKIKEIEGYIKYEKEYQKQQNNGNFNSKKPEHKDSVCLIAAIYGFELNKDTGMVNVKKAIERSIKWWEDSNPKTCYKGIPDEILKKKCASAIADWFNKDYNYVKNGVMYSATLDSNLNEKHINVMESMLEELDTEKEIEFLSVKAIEFLMGSFAEKFPNYNSSTKKLNLEFWFPNYPTTVTEYNKHCGFVVDEKIRKLKKFKSRVDSKKYKERMDALKKQETNCKRFHEIVSLSCQNTYVIKEKMIYAYQTKNCEIREVLKEDIKNDMERWRIIGATEAEILKHSQIIDEIEECERYFSEGMRWKYIAPTVDKDCKTK